MLIERLEVRLVELPLVEPFKAAHGSIASRQLVVVRVEAGDGVGWGECSALPEPTYTEEFAAGAYVVLEEQLGPRVVGHEVSAAGLASLLGDVVGHPMAKAALEMALLDIELRTADRSLAAHVGATAERVRAGAAVGLGSEADVAQRVASLAGEGFGRIKIKIVPGHDLHLVAAVRAMTPSVEIQVDGNGAYGPSDLDLLVELAESGVTAIEQPFAVGDNRSAAKLVNRCTIPIVADEAAGSLAAVSHLQERGALSGVSIKPPRLGGIEAAVGLHHWCADHDIAATAGGMVECGLGRHALAAVAALPGFTITGDLSPARRWLEADPWPDLVLNDGSIVTPSGPGVAPAPDEDVLDHYSTRQADLN